MLSSADAIGKIQQIYREGGREVPYLTFMSIFNDLLEDPVEVEPREPSEELAEKFRAACMAVTAGVHDPEGRAEDRMREFREKVLPAWREKLSEEEFAKYDDILEGGMRGKFKTGDQQEPAVSPEPGSRTSALLQRLGISEEEEGEEEEAAAAETGGRAEAPAPPEAEAASEAAEAEQEEQAEGAGFEDLLEMDLDEEEEQPQEEAAAPQPEPEPMAEAPTLPGVFPDVDALSAALQDELLEIEWQPRSEREPFAHYMLGDEEVGVSLVEGNTRNYVIASVSDGYPQVLNARQQMDDLVGAMGYRPTSEFYYRRKEGDFLLRIRMWPDRLDMACGYPKGGDKAIVIQQIQKIHRDMGELLERLNA